MTAPPFGALKVALTLMRSVTRYMVPLSVLKTYRSWPGTYCGSLSMYPSTVANIVLLFPTLPVSGTSPAMIPLSPVLPTMTR